MHLSADIQTALAVGRRKALEPILLVIDAQGAHRGHIDGAQRSLASSGAQNPGGNAAG